MLTPYRPAVVKRERRAHIEDRFVAVFRDGHGDFDMYSMPISHVAQRVVA